MGEPTLLTCGICGGKAPPTDRAHRLDKCVAELRARVEKAERELAAVLEYRRTGLDQLTDKMARIDEMTRDRDEAFRQRDIATEVRRQAEFYAERQQKRAEQAEVGWKRAAADLLWETRRANAAESALAEERVKTLEEAARVCDAVFGDWATNTRGNMLPAICGQRIRALASGNATRQQESQGAAAPQSHSELEELRRYKANTQAAWMATMDGKCSGCGGVRNWGLNGQIQAFCANCAAKLEHPAPIDIILHCPRCASQHVDAPEPGTDWTNPPHKSHKCHFCPTVWRPADVPTNGVADIKTRGRADTWPAAEPPPCPAFEPHPWPIYADEYCVQSVYVDGRPRLCGRSRKEHQAAGEETPK